ncbi:MAG: S8 family serine peptidase, partial [Nanoarchaeales archaeon]|nr:S8 family serine peptidase [Nanoarchaeales archaeon]
MFSFILVGFSKSIEFDLIPSFKVSNEKYFVIEFSDFIFEDDKNNLKSNGVNIISYIGNNSFLTKFDKNMINNIANLLFVKSVYRYKKPKSETKFNSINSITNRNKFIQRSVSKSEEKKMFEINLFDESISNEFKDEVLKLGGSIHSGDLERFNVFIEESKLDSLLQYEEVNYISEFSFNEILNSNSKGYTKVYDYFNKYNLYGEGQIIGIADTGFDIGVVSSSLHKDFLNKSISISTFTQSGLTDDGPSDKSTGHGTHVAGSVLGTGFLSGANLSTNTYINSNSGMAPKSDLFFQAMELKCDNSGICGSSLNKFVLVTPDNLATGMFQPAYDYGVRIHTNSWGDNTKKGVYSRDSFDADTFIWNNKDFTILFAAGNSGSSTKTVLSPSTSKNAITVGATSRDSSVVFFSSRGPTNDGRIKPDVVAPGTGIISTRSQVSTSGSGDYTFKQGTSMATPIVAGITSLVREYLIKNKEFINPSSALIKAMLINGARDVTGTVPDMNQGWGFVDLNRTLYESVSVSNQFFDIKSGLSTSQSFEYNFSFPRNSDELRITLVWSDYPGTPTGDGKELVNDLNLILITPNGTQYNGNDFTSPFNSSIDNVNNVEGIRIKDMMYGDYTLRVEGFNIPEDVQPFSFVISSGELIDFISVENLDSLKIFDKPYIEFNVSTTRNANKGWLSFDNENMNLSLDMINSTNFNSSFRFLDSGNYSFVVYMNDSISGEIFESYKREFIITNPEINFIKPNFNSTLKSLNYEVNFLLNFSKNISEIFYFNQTSYINLTDKLDN